MPYFINHQNEGISPPERKFTFGKTLAVVALVFYRNSGYMHRLLAKILAPAHTRHENSLLVRHWRLWLLFSTGIQVTCTGDWQKS